MKVGLRHGRRRRGLPPSLTSRATALAPLLFATALLAQQRQPLLGTVVDGRGAPVAGATVVLVEDDADLALLDPIDRIEVRSDERGRFVAAALRGTRYTGLAVGAEHDGSAAVCRPVRNLSCGGPAEMRLTIAAQRRKENLPGLRAWGPLADLRIQLRFEGCPGHAIDVPIDDTRIELPPIAAVADVVLTSREGRLLDQLLVPLDPAQPVQVPDPVSVDVVVVDEQGEPVAGALVSVQKVEPDMNWAWGSLRTLHGSGDFAVSDERGRARLRIPHWGSPFEQPPENLTLLATKAGFAESASGWVCKEPFVGWQVVAAHAKNTIRLPLAAATPRRGTILGRELAGRMIRVFAMGHATQTRDGMLMSYYVPRRYDAAVGEDGSYTVPELPREVGAIHLQLPPVDGVRLVALPSRNGTLPSIDLADFAPLSLQVLDEQGGPAAGAVVLLVPTDCASDDLAHAPPLALDRAGRMEVRLQRGRWTVLAMTPSGWAMLDLESWWTKEPETMVLAPKPSQRVRVVDAEGKPVAGARFEVGEFRPALPLPGPGALLRELGWNTFAEHVRRGLTDARGEVTLQFLPWPGAQPTAYAWLGDWKRRSADFRVVEGDAPVTVSLPR